MNTRLSVILWSVAIHYNVSAQVKAGVEQYSYISPEAAIAIVPLCYIESAKKWHTELRYNYEDAQTFSIYTGKTLTSNKALEFSITPMLGFSAGKFTGVSLAANADADWKNFYLSSQTQYSIATQKKTENFFFSWTELGYNITRHFFSGLAMQYTLQKSKTAFEPGLTAGLNFNTLSFPLYVFSPFRPGSYFILGVNYEYSFKKK